MAAIVYRSSGKSKKTASNSRGTIEGYYYSKDSTKIEPNQYIDLKIVPKYSSSIFPFI